VGGLFFGSRRDTRLPLLVLTLVVVRDLDFVCITVLPSETHSVLVINTNAVLAGTLTLERLEPIARWNCKVQQIPDPIDLV
jgi:hypothetical protein